MARILCLLTVLIVIVTINLSFVSSFGPFRSSFFGERSHQQFITNGFSASYGFFPYQAALMFYDSDLNSEFCGGVLISRNNLITAAHCVKHAVGAIVYLGATNLKNIQNQKDIYSCRVKSGNITIHPKYDAETFLNDIAVLQIEPVNFAKYLNVRPVKLPKYAEIPYGLKVNSSGFGLTADNSTIISNELQYVTLEVANEALCKNTYGNVSKCQICVKTQNGQSSCTGDSGGPLTTADNVAIGLVSYGSSKGCEKDYPVVYTNVACYLKWINEVIIGN